MLPDNKGWLVEARDASLLRIMIAVRMTKNRRLLVVITLACPPASLAVRGSMHYSPER